MSAIKYTIGFWILVLTGIYLLFFTFNDWFAVTMPRHQILQLPAALLLGVVTGFWYRNKISLSYYLKITGIIFLMGSLLFWMLPRSVDLAVMDSRFNLLMLLNMFLAGIITFFSIRKSELEIQTIFFVMMTSMLMGVGFILINFKILVCSAFDISQQQQTGYYLLGIGVAFLIFTYVNFIFKVGRKS